MRELLLAMDAAGSDSESDKATRTAIASEVQARSSAELVEQLAAIAGDEELGVRRHVAGLLQWHGVRDDLTPASQETCRRVLLQLLGDIDEPVRAGSLFGLILLQQQDPWPEVPENIVAALRLQLASSLPQSRHLAAWGAMLLGSKAQVLVEELLATDTSGDAAWIASTVAGALGAIGLPDERVVHRLSAMLDHPERGVRMVAADSLGELGQVAASAVPLLLTRLEDRGEDASVRRSARTALVALCEPAQIDRVLEFVLQERQLYEETDFSWCVDVGKLAACVAESKLGAKALQVLTEIRAAGDASDLVAASAMARILLRREDKARLAGIVAQLQGAVREMESEIGVDYWHAPMDAPVLETLVDVFLAEPGTVDVGDLKRVLEKLAAVKDRFGREWAEAQLIRLPS